MNSIPPPADTGQQERQQIFSLRQVVFVLFRRRWIIMCVSLPIMLVGVLGLLGHTRTFTASCKVLLELQSPDQPRWDTRGSSIDFDRELSTYRHMAMSVPVAQMAADRLADSLNVIVRMDPSFSELRKRDNLVEFLLDHMDVSTIGDSNLLDIQFGSIHPNMALMGARACRDAFMDYAVSAGKRRESVGYYREQIRDVAGEIDSLLAIRSGVLQEAGYSSIQDDFRYEAGQVTELEDDYYKEVTARKTLESKIASLKASLAEDPRFFPMGEREGDTGTLIYLKNIVSKHEDKLNELRALHPEDSVPVQRQREVLERAIENLRAEVEVYIESLEIDLAAARAKEASLLGMIDSFKEVTWKAPAVYQRVTLLDTEINTRRSLLEDLQVKMGEVRLSAQADKRISSMLALTDPELVKVFAGGQPLIYFGLVCFFALSLGIVVGFIAENLDHRIYNRRQAEQYLRLRVFGTVSEVR
jgi:uncharacterized protein involved in exopolysaccharide biosynthesis